MAVRCFQPLQGERVRVTELDECGNVPEGALSVVSDGAITIQISSEIEAGDEFIVKNAAGRICLNYKDQDSLKRLNIDSIEWCDVDPMIYNLLSGFPTVHDGDSPGDDIVGFRITEGKLDTKVAVELWTNLGGDACGEEGDQCWGYVLLPYMTGFSIGDFTVENGPVTFSSTNGYTQGNSGWGTGPYDDVVGMTPDSCTALTTAFQPDEHAEIRVTCCNPPAPGCGPVIDTSPGD